MKIIGWLVKAARFIHIGDQVEACQPAFIAPAIVGCQTPSALAHAAAE